jgi:hypothetical protein
VMKSKGYVLENVYWMQKDENDKWLGNDDGLFL